MTLLRSLPLSWSPAVSNAKERPQVLPTPSPSGAPGIQHFWCTVAKQPLLSRTMNFTYKTPRSRQPAVLEGWLSKPRNSQRFLFRDLGKLR